MKSGIVAAGTAGGPTTAGAGLFGKNGCASGDRGLAPGDRPTCPWGFPAMDNELLTSCPMENTTNTHIDRAETRGAMNVNFTLKFLKFK
jgi:hypothetical protein